MDGGRRSRFGAALAAALLIVFDAVAGTTAETWPVEPNAGVVAANIPAVAPVTMVVAGDGSVFLAWNGANAEPRVQKLNADGSRAWGDTGVAVLTGAVSGGLTGHVFPTSDGGVWVAFAEINPTFNLRVQRIDSDGAPMFAAEGVVVFADLPTVVGYPGMTIATDEADGLDAVAVAWTGRLMFQHVDGDGRLARPGGGLVLDAGRVEARFPTITHLPTGAAAVTWMADGALRLQIVGKRGKHLPGRGAALAKGVFSGFRSVRVTGGPRRPKLLVSYLTADHCTPHLVLARLDGVVMFDEAAAPTHTVSCYDFGQLYMAPAISAIGGVRRGAPVGVELHGVTRDGTAMRYVRLTGASHWANPEAIVPPGRNSDQLRGAMAGSLWTWDMLEHDADGESLRLIAYRVSTQDADLVPRLGPWLALCPGSADRPPRLVRAGPWLYLAWVNPTTENRSIRVTRVAVEPVPGEPEILGPRITSLIVADTAAVPGQRHLDITAETATLPATDSQGLRLLLGDDGGIKATMLATTFHGAASGSWTADFATQDGAVTGTVTVGDDGRGLAIHVDNAPLDSGDRALYVRIETATTSRMATLLLNTDGTGAASF